MARMAFDDMETEVTLRLGNHNYTGFAARVQEWIKAAYYHCALGWEHVELHATDTSETLSASSSTVNLAADCYIVMQVAFYDPGTTDFRKVLEPRHYRYLQSRFSEADAEPQEVARFGNTLQFDSNSDAAYPVVIFYYKEPTEPDFTTPGTSELAPVWDEVVLRFATALGFGALLRRDHEQIELANAQSLLQMLPNPPLNADVLMDRATRRLKDASLAGGMG